MKAVFFDFDGVVVDSEKEWFKVINEVLAKRNLKIPENMYSHFVGKTEQKVMKDFFGGLLNEEEQKEIIDQAITVWHTRLRRLKQLPGINSLFLFCIENLMKKYIVTGTSLDLVKKVLANNHSSQYFDGYVTIEDYQESKPSPQAYHTALKKFNLLPEEVVAIEDSPAGVKAAKNAGIKVIALNSAGLDHSLFDTEFIVSSHQEVIKLLSNWISA